MSKRKEKTTKATVLRQRVENILVEKQAEISLPDTQADILKLLHELQVNQIELEAQNQELRLARREIENVLERYTDLYEFAPVGYLTLDCKGMTLQLNLTSAALLGIDRSHLLNRRLGQFVSAETRPIYNAFLKKICDSNDKESCEVVFINDKNNRIFVRMEARATVPGQQFRVAIEEITDLKLVDKALSRVDSYNRCLIEASLDPLVTITLDGKIGDVNAATELITGRTRDELIGTDFSDYFTEPEKARVGYRRVFTDGSVRDYELSMRNRDGQVRPVLYNASVYRDEAGNGIGVFAAARDITERKRVENLIQQDAARAETMAETSRSLVEAGTDQQAILNAVARTTATIIGNVCIIRLLSNDGEYLDPAAIYHADPKTLAFMQEKFAGVRQRTNTGLAGHVFTTGQPVLMPAVSFDEISHMASHHYVAILKHVGVSSLLIVPLHTQVSIIGTLALFRLHSENPFTLEDQALLESLAGQAALAISNARLYKDLANSLQQELAMREQLIRAEKHMAISRMVASVAHEINNPLQTIQNCMYLAEQEVPPNSEVREYIEMASSESKRISSLVGQLREVYRPGQPGAKQPVDLLKTLEDTHALLTPHLANQNIHWVKIERLNEHPEDQPMINGFVDQIKQVFLNISMNAIEAMQPRGGTLTVGLIQNPSGDQVGVYFQDSGPGITNESLEKLFEPFFTTKDSGVGLGLSICYEIIQRHGGRIDVTNEIDHGAKFTVWLPIFTATPNTSS